MRPILIATAAALIAAPAAAQLSDQSGPLTFTLQMAKHVELVSHAPSTHEITGTLEGTQLTVREVRANTPFRATVVGLTADRKLVFRNASGHEISLTTTCDMLTSADPATRGTQTSYDCLNSPVFHPGMQSMATRWMLFHARLAPDITNATAGVYTATVYLQIDAT